MNLSPKGLDFLKKLEGFSPIPYKCSAGCPTIGYGHALLPHEHFTEITLDEALRLLKEDIEKKEQSLRRIFSKECLSRLKPHQYDALVIFIFNVGDKKEFITSNMAKFLNLGFYDQAIIFWRKWIHVWDKEKKCYVPCEGLKNRRNAEIELFMGNTKGR